MTEQQATHSTGKRARIGWKKSVAYGLATTTAFFVVLELALRLVGFQFVPGPLEVRVTGEVVAGAYRRSHPRKPMPVIQAHEGKFDYSREMIWTPVAGVAPFNRRKFVGLELPRERSGHLRIACLGDSCTQLGQPPYPTVLGELLTRCWQREVEVLNAGVVGYSTFQGLARLENEVLPYKPDVVTLYFGWNDHWSIDRVRDPELAREMGDPWFGWVDYVGWSRVVQALLWGYVELSEATAGDVEGAARDQYVLRVDLPQYRRNLHRLIALCRDHGAVPILITAPTSLRTGPTPSYYQARMAGEAGRLFDSLPKMHAEYVEATRQVAAETGAPLVDAYAAFGDGETLLRHDHIHLTPEGIQRMAGLLAAAVVEQVESDPELVRRVGLSSDE